MKFYIYSIYDSKAEIYSKPFYAQSKGEALRSFSDVAKDKQHPIGKHPEDYTLFELGVFEDSTAELKNHKTNISCGIAIEYISQDTN